MSLYERLIAALWVILVVVWAVTAFAAKRTVGGNAGSSELALRIVLVVIIVALVRTPLVFHAVMLANVRLSASAVAGTIGVACCALGVALAVWARIHIGRNWGMPMTRKEDRELVTSGPYAFVRHPIYGGLILMMLGSAIGANAFWVLPLVMFGGYFLYTARREEQHLLEEFPQRYREYMRRTSMLLPWGRTGSARTGAD